VAQISKRIQAENLFQKENEYHSKLETAGNQSSRASCVWVEPHLLLLLLIPNQTFIPLCHSFLNVALIIKRENHSQGCRLFLILKTFWKSNENEFGAVITTLR
jgi:hypothetical protein